MLMLDFLQSFPPLQVRVLEDGSLAPRGITNDDFRVIVLEHSQETNQGGITPCLPGQRQSENSQYQFIVVSSSVSFTLFESGKA